MKALLDLPAAFAASQTGKGCPLPDLAALLRFDAYVRARGAVVCNIETYEVRGEDRYARIDLGIYQGGETDQLKPPGQRLAESANVLRWIVGDVEREGIACEFLVWSDDL